MAKFEKGNKAGKKFTAGAAQSEIARQGAIASNEKQAERKRLRELAEIIANEPISTTMPDGSKRSTTFSEALIIGQYREAMKGKTEAAKFLATIMGDFVEKVETKQDLTVKDETAGMTFEQKKRLADLLEDIEHERYMEQHYGKDYETDTTE